MKWQSTAILAVLAIGIGSYIYFVERKAAAPPSDDRTIFIWNMSDNQAEPVNRVMLRAGDKKVTYVKQSPAPTPKPTGSNTPEPWATPPQPTWHLEGKLDRGLTYTWDSAWTDLKRLQADRIVEERAADMTLYEFASPSLEVRLTDDKAKELYALTVGKKAISGSGYYARSGKDQAVYLVPAYRIDNWKRLVEDPPLASPTPAPTLGPTPTPTPTPIASPGTSATASATVKPR